MASSSYTPVTVVEDGHVELMKSIGKRLEEIRKARNISVINLCDDVKMSRTTYYRMSEGVIYFNTHKFFRILEKLEISASDFFKDIK